MSSSSTQEMNFDEYVRSLLIPIEEIEYATNNFADENLLTRGSSFHVYKGQLLLQQGDSINIVARKCPQRLILGNEIGNEIAFLPYLKHKNIVSTYKWTLKDIGKDDEAFIIINKYEANESLDKHLGSPTLTWMQRYVSGSHMH
ncbi:putative non-specific serine/threonine protein kinase [Helianthus annuus]|nr:putative non-specific serine/threonine protein kinase [Helianthus annuus]